MSLLDEQLSELDRLDRPALIRRFELAYGRSPPPRISTYAITLAVAYRLQEQALGGLSASVRRQIVATGTRDHGSATDQASRAARVARSANPGTTLIREWQGRPHTVVVHADGVEYAGQRFRSLTDVALRITGQKRSGPAFFGLRSSRV